MHAWYGSRHWTVTTGCSADPFWKSGFASVGCSGSATARQKKPRKDRCNFRLGCADAKLKNCTASALYCRYPEDMSRSLKKPHTLGRQDTVLRLELVFSAWNENVKPNAVCWSHLNALGCLPDMKDALEMQFCCCCCTINCGCTIKSLHLFGLSANAPDPFC